jgi:hypothetical protein
LGAAGVTLNLIRGQKKPAGYLGGFYGTEVVTQNTWSGETLPTRPTPDLLLEAGIPLPEAEEEQAAESTGTMSFMPSLVVGAYRTGGETAEETGLYFGLRQEQLPWAVGFGVNLDALHRVGGFAGYLLAPPLLLNHVICMAYDPNYPCQ